MPQLKLENIRDLFPNFQNCARCEDHLKDNKHTSLYWARKYVRMIICSSKLTVFFDLRSRKTVRFWEQIMSVSKYPSMFSSQMVISVYISNAHSWNTCEVVLIT